MSYCAFIMPSIYKFVLSLSILDITDSVLTFVLEKFKEILSPGTLWLEGSQRAGVRIKFYVLSG